MCTAVHYSRLLIMNKLLQVKFIKLELHRATEGTERDSVKYSEL